MALLGQAQRESVFDNSELDHFRRLVDYGHTFTFKSDKDGQDDTIKGVIEVQFKRQTAMGFDVFRFEEFKSEDVEGRGGIPVAHFEKIHFRQSKLRFRADSKRRIAYAMVPDTRRNRDLLADMHFDRAGVIYLRENTREKDISAAQLQREISEIALIRKAEREKLRHERQGDTMDRTLRNMTPQQKEEMLKRLMAEENAKRAPLALNPMTQVQTGSPQTASTGAGVSMAGNAASTGAGVSMAGNAASSQKPDIVSIPRPENAKDYQTMRTEAKRIIQEIYKDDIDALKKKKGKWHISKEYRHKIAPKIDELVQFWAKDAQVDNVQAPEPASPMVS